MYGFINAIYIAHFFCQKGTVADKAWFITRESKRVIDVFYLLITLRN